MLSRPMLANAAVFAGAIGVVASTFMPWLQSGQERRTSYELVSVARRIQEAPTEAIRVATFWWPAVPLLVVASVVAVLWGKARLGALLGLLGAGYVGTFALVFWSLDIPPLAGVQIGSTVGAATASSAAFAVALIVNVFCWTPHMSPNVRRSGDIP